MRYSTLAAFFIVCAAPALAEDPPAGYFALINAEDGRKFNEADWRRAVAATDQRIYWRLDTDFYTIDRTLEIAVSAPNDPVFAFLMAANLPTDDEQKYLKVVNTIVADIQDDDLLAGSNILFQSPGCTLLRKPLTGEEFTHTHTLFTMEQSDRRTTCYQEVIGFVLDSPDLFVPPDPPRTTVDQQAQAIQDITPPLVVQNAAFIDTAASDAEGKTIGRRDAVFAPNEPIVLHVNFANAGRYYPGTARATYEIMLDLDIRDVQDQSLQAFPDAIRFTGPAVHRVPIPDDYFDNFITVTFALGDPGTYKLAYRFTDLTRPQSQTAPVEVVMKIKIE